MVINQKLRQEVLEIVDKLYKSLFLLNKSDKEIALPIVESISFNYAHQNCGLHFIFEDTVIPYLKKMDENQRLEKVKALLTEGYIDIGKERIHMLFLPYLNNGKLSFPNGTAFITSI